MRSDAIKKGPKKLPHRTLLKALGLTDSEIERPLIGIVCAKNDIIPGHMHLGLIAQAVKDGIRLEHRLSSLQSAYATVLLWGITECTIPLSAVSI